MISFIGAGPGAADLVTLRGVERLANADVVIWAASLVSRELLDHCHADALIHDSKTMTLADVCAVFDAHPDAAIARLHSGDPSVYSAIGEQIAWCREHGRTFEVVPGVSAMHAAAAAAGCELTIPGVAQSVVVTRVAGRTRASMPDRETIEAYATTGATLAVHLSVTHVDELVDRLLSPTSAYDSATPVLIAYRATWPDEVIVATTIGQLVDEVHRLGIDATTVFLVGPALAGAGDRRSHVYDPAYATRFRPGIGAGRD